MNGRYGWQDGLGGVEPGFSSAPALQFGRQRDETDEPDVAPYGAPASPATARDQDWLRNLLD